MKIYLLALPIALAVLAGCGGRATSSSGLPVSSSASTASAPLIASSLATRSSFSPANSVSSNRAVSSITVSSAMSSADSATGDRFNLSAAEVERSVICPKSAVPDLMTAVWPSRTAIDETIRAALAKGGLQGSVHGLVKKDHKYVFLLRPIGDSSGLFNERMSVFSRDPAIVAQLATLKRNDSVEVQGEWVTTASPQPHIHITQLTVTRRVDRLGGDYLHQNGDAIFAGLSRAKLLGTVHTVLNGGEAIVMNFEDMVLPIMVDEPWRKIAASLWRADRIQVDVSIQQVPGRTTHFYTRVDSPEAIKIVDRMANCHNKRMTLEGELGRLDSENFLLIKTTDANNVPMIFLMLPGSAGELALRDLWGDAAFNPQTDQVGRNHFYRSGIKVRVTGQVLVLAPGVAHPQMRVLDAADVQVISRE